MSDDNVSIEGGDSPRLVIDGPKAMNESIERLFLACRSSLLVRARRLDFDFYFSETFTETCQSIIVRDTRNELLFLLEDEPYLMKANSRLLALARKFSSYIKIRIIPKEYIEQQETFIVCDAIAYLHQPKMEFARGVMDLSDRGRARKLSLKFKEVWERSPEPSELFTAGL